MVEERRWSGVEEEGSMVEDRRIWSGVEEMRRWSGGEEEMEWSGGDGLLKFSFKGGLFLKYFCLHRLVYSICT